MGNGMNKVLPGLYVGNYRDSKDKQQLEKHGITHIIAIHDSPRRLLPDKHYLCVMASDTPDQNLSQYFSVCNDFIHAARLREGNVLIHCLAGMSRSVTVAVAYIMTVTNLNWKEALKVVRAGRAVANPNFGFQAQLNEFETYRVAEERRRLRERFPSNALNQLDYAKCKAALESYQELLQNRDICEGNCVRGEKCPTGVCNIDPNIGLFRRKQSVRSRLRTDSMASSSSICLDADSSAGRISISASTSIAKVATATASTSSRANTIQSCPTSPNHRAFIRSSLRQREHSISESCEIPRSSSDVPDKQRDLQLGRHDSKKPLTKSRIALDESSSSEALGGISTAKSKTAQMAGRTKQDTLGVGHAAGGERLHRSASTISGLRERPWSSPAGLQSYTGSVPSTVHGSQVDLCNSGSAIYVGFPPPRNSNSTRQSSSRSSCSSAPPSPARTPPLKERRIVKR